MAMFQRMPVISSQVFTSKSTTSKHEKKYLYVFDESAEFPSASQIE